MANGGIIGPTNTTSFGKNTIHNKTSSGCFTTQPGTRLANVVVVAGGGGGGSGPDSSSGTGVSGGGGPVASWLQNSSDKSLVDGVILEAPTFNFIESVEVNGQARFPWLPESLFDYYTWLAEVRFGIDFDSMDYREAVIDSTVPMLLFHGDDDEWIPVSLSDFIASKRDKNLTYMRYENVGHVQAWNADPELYIKTVSNFLTSLEK